MCCWEGRDISKALVFGEISVIFVIWNGRNSVEEKLLIPCEHMNLTHMNLSKGEDFSEKPNRAGAIFIGLILELCHNGFQSRCPLCRPIRCKYSGFSLIGMEIFINGSLHIQYLSYGIEHITTMTDAPMKEEMFACMEDILSTLGKIQLGDIELLGEVERVGLWRGDYELESNIQQLKEKSDILSNSCTKLAMVTLECYRAGCITCAYEHFR